MTRGQNRDYSYCTFRTRTVRPEIMSLEYCIIAIHLYSARQSRRIFFCKSADSTISWYNLSTKHFLTCVHSLSGVSLLYAQSRTLHVTFCPPFFFWLRVHDDAATPDCMSSHNLEFTFISAQTARHSGDFLPLNCVRVWFPNSKYSFLLLLIHDNTLILWIEAWLSIVTNAGAKSVQPNRRAEFFSITLASTFIFDTSPPTCIHIHIHTVRMYIPRHPDNHSYFLSPISQVDQAWREQWPLPDKKH